jgi:predicted dehydrogenase
MRKIRIGVLGCAAIAERLVVPNMLLAGKFEIIAFASRDLTKAQKFADLFGGIAIEGYENLIKLEDVEAIYIPLPTGLHFEWIMRSLDFNKHVFCEKSLSISYGEVREIVNKAVQKKLTVFENFMFPFHTQFEFVKNKINLGVIGDLRIFKSSFGFPMFDLNSNIRYSKALGGGALLDAGAYTIMAAQLFLGNKLNVTASSLLNLGNEVDFLGAVTLVNDHNIIAQLVFGFDNFYQNNVELWGTKGKIIIERAFTAGPDYTPVIRIENQNENHIYQLNKDNHFLGILNKFYSCIVQDEYDYQFNQILSQSRLIEEVRIINSNRNVE